MQYFQKDKENIVAVIAADGVTPVTGKVASDFTMYVSKAGGTPVAVTLTGLVNELDSTNMPGVYTFTLPAAVFNTTGRILFTVACAGADKYNILGDIGFYDSILDVRSLCGHANFRIKNTTFDGNRNMTAATMVGYDNAVDAAADTNPRVTLAITTATYDANGNIDDFVVEEQ